MQFLPEAGYIPYRCLYVPEISNLLVTGRAISADRTAFASTRVQATAMAVGQAAGVAAALCAGKHQAVDQVEYSLLRASLRRQKAIV